MKSIVLGIVLLLSPTLFANECSYQKGFNLAWIIAKAEEGDKRLHQYPGRSILTNEVRNISSMLDNDVCKLVKKMFSKLDRMKAINKSFSAAAFSLFKEDSPETTREIQENFNSYMNKIKDVSPGGSWLTNNFPALDHTLFACSRNASINREAIVEELKKRNKLDNQIFLIEKESIDKTMLLIKGHSKQMMQTCQ